MLEFIAGVVAGIIISELVGLWIHNKIKPLKTAFDEFERNHILRNAAK